MTDWPKVTVQLPIYNERYVIERLIEAVAQFDYPRDLLRNPSARRFDRRNAAVASRLCGTASSARACRFSISIAIIAKASRPARCRKV